MMKPQRPSVWFWLQMVLFIPIAPGFFCMQVTKDWIQKTWPRSSFVSLCGFVLAPLVGGLVAGITVVLIFEGVRALVRAL